MRTTTVITALSACTLLLVPLSSIAQGHRHGNEANSQHRAQVERGQRDTGDRLRDRDRISAPAQDRDRDRDQDRTKAPDSAGQAENRIYGHDLMSEEERHQYRERIRNAENRQEAEQIEAQHRHKMQIRAKNKGVEIEEPTMAQTGKEQ